VGAVTLELVGSSSGWGVASRTRLFRVHAPGELVLYSPSRMPPRRHGGGERHVLTRPARWLDGAVLALLAVERQAPGRSCSQRGHSAEEPGAARAGAADALDLEAPGVREVGPLLLF
jgi:hypothetical protein